MLSLHSGLREAGLLTWQPKGPKENLPKEINKSYGAFSTQVSELKGVISATIGSAFPSLPVQQEETKTSTYSFKSMTKLKVLNYSS